MKKLLFVLVALLVGGARADNVVTSREYVDAQANTLQTTLPAKNENTVLLNTETAGEVGEKAIYDASADYATQSDALVTAGQFNTAVQNALESEFVCIERQNGNGGCLLYEIRGSTPSIANKIANGYTQLEYIESVGSPWIDTNIIYTAQDTGLAELDVVFFQLSYTGTNAFMQLTKNKNDCLTIGYGGLSECVSPYVRNKIVQSWDGPTMTSGLYHNDQRINSVTWDSEISTFRPKYTIFTLINGTYQSSGRVYSLKLTKNNELVRNMVPAKRDTDGDVGMYDTITNTFFTNRRDSGEFAAGPVVNTYLPQGNQ